MPIMPFIILGPLTVDETALGQVVTIILVSLLLIREFTACARPRFKGVRYLDIMIAPLLVLFALLIIELLLSPG